MTKGANNSDVIGLSALKQIGEKHTVLYVAHPSKLYKHNLTSMLPIPAIRYPFATILDEPRSPKGTFLCGINFSYRIET